jgi:hypothetical protein
MIPISLGFVILVPLALSAPRVVFDRVAGTVRGRRLILDGERTGEIALRDVAAVQICSAWIAAGRGSHRSFEINLVLFDGRRCWLFAHAAENALRREAEQLAMFLGVTVIDHAGAET